MNENNGPRGGSDGRGRGDGRGAGGGAGRAGQGRGGQGRSGPGRPSSGRGGSGRSGRGRQEDQGGRPGSSRGAGGDRRSQSSEGRRSFERSGTGRGPRRVERQVERTAEQQIYDGPPIPDDVSAKDLDKAVRVELQGIPEKLAERVAKHLVMAEHLIDEDPETAHRHALAARARAMRVGIVREATGETAYACGRWSEALSEFRAARRMTGRAIYAPMMADCERALRRPEKALEYDRPEVRSKLDEAGNVELTIVVAGARRDLRQHEAALQLLETEPLHSNARADWLVRLRYAYADTLLEMGRREDAINWFHRTVAIDSESITDADERVAALEA